jgi:hypothetical protein
MNDTLLTYCRDFAMVTFSATVTLALEVRKTSDPDPQLLQAIAESERILDRVKSNNKLAKDALSILQELRNTGSSPSIQSV